MAVEFTVYKIKKGIDVDTAIWTNDPTKQAEQVFEVRHGSDFKELVDEMFKDKKNRLSDDTDNIQCFLKDFQTKKAKEIVEENINKYHLTSRVDWNCFISLLKEADKPDANFYLVCSVM